ncbi:MAG: hypothetical protein KatS3mg076_1940 [Candidatus Binatia bacterium]|nr:MAG: hypothetical protein KatS3mg076_1940 [Candidatus Binatia bacterium]
MEAPKQAAPPPTTALWWASVAIEARKELLRLGLLRGTSRRTWRKRTAVAAVALAAGALATPCEAGVPTLVPNFVGPWNPFGLPVSQDPPRNVEFVDLDGDGDLDAFFSSAEPRFSENIGSATLPVFTPPVSNPFGLEVQRTPAFAFVDIDGDGDLDAFAGYHFGEELLFFFENTGTPEMPAFASPVPDPFGLSGDISEPVPEFVDIDGDGDFDLFVGDASGYTSFFENTGSPASPAFAAPLTGAFGLAKVPYSSHPKFVDVDGDGDLDALLGGYGTLLFQENTGSASMPAFGPARSNEFGVPLRLRHDYVIDLRPEAVDIDGDGDFDLFFAEEGGRTRFFENRREATRPDFVVRMRDPFGLYATSEYGVRFVDIDLDGDVDALGVDRAAGVVFFENTGSPSRPAFAPPVSDTFGLSLVDPARTAHFVDIDGDGDLDVFSTYYPELVFFENTGSASEPAFGPAQQNPFGFDASGHPIFDSAFADLDGDGDLDLLALRDEGYALWENTGSATSPSFAAPVTRNFGVTLPSVTAPSFADIDGDGDLDAFVVDYYGNSLFLENTGSATQPAFAPARTNVFGLPRRSYPFDPLVFFDIDGDGDLDTGFFEYDRGNAYVTSSAQHG